VKNYSTSGASRTIRLDLLLREGEQIAQQFTSCEKIDFICTGDPVWSPVFQKTRTGSGGHAGALCQDILYTTWMPG
jgi:hypothetical protein